MAFIAYSNTKRRSSECREIFLYGSYGYEFSALNKQSGWDGNIMITDSSMEAIERAESLPSQYPDLKIEVRVDKYDNIIMTPLEIDNPDLFKMHCALGLLRRVTDTNYNVLILDMLNACNKSGIDYMDYFTSSSCSGPRQWLVTLTSDQMVDINQHLQRRAVATKTDRVLSLYYRSIKNFLKVDWENHMDMVKNTNLEAMVDKPIRTLCTYLHVNMDGYASTFVNCKGGPSIDCRFALPYYMALKKRGL